MEGLVEGEEGPLGGGRSGRTLRDAMGNVDGCRDAGGTELSVELTDFITESRCHQLQTLHS